MNSKAHPVFEQISLFDDAYTLLNSGLADLISLNLQAARNSFGCYGKLYRAREQVEDFLQAIDYLAEKLAQIPDKKEEPAHLYDVLKTFETDADTVFCGHLQPVICQFSNPAGLSRHGLFDSCSREDL